MKLCPDEIFHPLSQLFPEMSPERFVILKLDINEHGIRVPVLMYEGKVLDGRARWRAAQELGIPCPTVEYDGSTPVLELLSLNAIRRDMSSGQRAITAAKLANLVEGRPTKTASIDGVSEDRAARLLDVSVRAVQRAKKILKANRTDLIAAVGSGSMSISRAAKITSTGVSGTATPTE